MMEKELLKQIFNPRGKKIISLFLFLFITIQSIYAQRFLKEFDGNIEITDTFMIKSINGFYKYLQENYKTFNSSDYFIGVGISHTIDSVDEIELTISNYVMSRPMVKKLPGYYGFLKRNGIYFLFWKESVFVKKKNNVSNPNLFKKYKTHRIFAPYDPYVWKIHFKNHQIVDLFPKETIFKYLN